MKSKLFIICFLVLVIVFLHLFSGQAQGFATDPTSSYYCRRNSFPGTETGTCTSVMGPYSYATNSSLGTINAQLFEMRYEAHLEGHGGFGQSGGKGALSGCINSNGVMWDGSCWNFVSSSGAGDVGDGNADFAGGNGIGNDFNPSYRYAVYDFYVNDADWEPVSLEVAVRGVQIINTGTFNTTAQTINVGQQISLPWEIDWSDTTELQVSDSGILSCNPSGGVNNYGTATCTGVSAGTATVTARGEGPTGLGKRTISRTKSITVNAVVGPPPPLPPPPPPGAPSADIRCNNNNSCSISSGSSAQIEWCGTSHTACANASSCTVTFPGGSWTGTSGDRTTGALTSTRTYNLSCTGNGQTTTDSVTVTVTGGSCTDNAAVSSTTLPANLTLSPGQVYGFDITMQNNGTTWWHNGGVGGNGNESSGYKFLQTSPATLTIVGTDACGGPPNNLNYGHLCGGLNVGLTRLWSFNLTAPLAPGTYTFSMNMSHAGGLGYRTSSGAACSGAALAAGPNYFGQSFTSTITVLAPPPPTGLILSCPAPYTTVTASWTPPAGWNTFYFRANPGVNNGAWPAAVIQDSVVGTTTSFASTPGQSYYVWIHTRDPVSGAWSSAVDGNVSCNPPAPTADIVCQQGGVLINGNCTIPYNTQATVNWCGTGVAACPNSTSCTLYRDGVVIGSGPSPSGYITPTGLTANSYFELECVGPGGTSPRDRVDITVSAPPPLNVTLGAVPTTGTVPFATTYTAAVTSSLSTINYSFWWDCSNITNSVATASTACGALPTPAAGTCAGNAVGYKCNAVSNTTQTALTTHTIAGVKIGKVIVESGSSTPVQDQITVNAIPPVPVITNAAVVEPNYCASGPGATLTWTVSGNGPQASYRVQIDNTAGFPSPEYDVTVSSGASAHNVPAGTLQLNNTYRARIIVTNNQGGSTPWINVGTCTPSNPNSGCNADGSWDTPTYNYPQVGFNWTPPNPARGIPVQFNDTTVFGNPNSPRQWTWSWNDGTSNTIINRPPNTNGNTTHTFNNAGTFAVSLTARDASGQTCTTAPPSNVNVQKPIPIWKEILPR